MLADEYLADVSHGGFEIGKIREPGGDEGELRLRKRNTPNGVSG